MTKMMINIGNANIVNIYVGDSAATAVYVGDTQVYPVVTDAPFTIEALSGGTLTWDNTDILSYSVNGGTWNSWTGSTSVNSGDTVSFKGQFNNYDGSGKIYTSAQMPMTDFDFNASGNINSLGYGDNYQEVSALTKAYADLFKGNTHLISAENLRLPSTVIAVAFAYNDTFSDCTNLIKAPKELPATDLGGGSNNKGFCYTGTFARCTSLVKAPDILCSNYNGFYSLRWMFDGCTSLNYIKCLIENNSSKSAQFQDWVRNVSATGTFVKAPNSVWTSGTKGIPSNWTQVDAS